MRYDKDREEGHWRDQKDRFNGTGPWYSDRLVGWIRPENCITCQGQLDPNRTWWFCNICVKNGNNADYDITGKRWCSFFDPLLCAIIESEIYNERQHERD